MSKAIVFDDIASIFHLFLGIVAGLNISSILSIAIISAYTVYQVLDKKDSKTEKLGDFIELLVGCVTGLILKEVIIW